MVNASFREVRLGRKQAQRWRRESCLLRQTVFLKGIYEEWLKEPDEENLQREAVQFHG